MLTEDRPTSAARRRRPTGAAPALRLDTAFVRVDRRGACHVRMARLAGSPAPLSYAWSCPTASVCTHHRTETTEVEPPRTTGTRRRELRCDLEAVGAEIVFAGHTHQPNDRTLDGVRRPQIGSVSNTIVGQPARVLRRRPRGSARGRWVGHLRVGHGATSSSSLYAVARSRHPFAEHIASREAIKPAIPHAAHEHRRQRHDAHRSSAVRRLLTRLTRPGISPFRVNHLLRDISSNRTCGSGGGHWGR